MNQAGMMESTREYAGEPEVCRSAIQEEFERVVSTSRSRLLNVARNILESHEDAEDVVQTACLKAHKNLDSFRHAANLATWVHRITVNECFALLRKRKVRARCTSLDELMETSGDSSFGLLDPAKGPESECELREAAGKLHAAMSELREPQYTIVSLRVFDEMSNAEAAAMLRKSVPAVKSDFYRALVHLRERLQTMQTPREFAHSKTM